MSQTNERAVETYVEEILLTHGGWKSAIAAYLGEETAKLDALVTQVEEAVERLQEYRSALITAAVTGKIRV
jgi:hypothetical protein